MQSSQPNIQQQRMDIQRRIKKLQQRLKSVNNRNNLIQKSQNNNNNNNNQSFKQSNNKPYQQKTILTNNSNTLNLIHNSSNHLQKNTQSYQSNIHQINNPLYSYSNQKNKVPINSYQHQQQNIKAIKKNINYGSNYNYNQYNQYNRYDNNISNNHNIKANTMPISNHFLKSSYKHQPYNTLINNETIQNEKSKQKIVNLPNNNLNKRFQKQLYNNPKQSLKDSLRKQNHNYNKENDFQHELYDMMKVIMEGQKKLQNQIKDLKFNNNYQKKLETNHIINQQNINKIESSINNNRLLSYSQNKSNQKKEIENNNILQNQNVKDNNKYSNRNTFGPNNHLNYKQKQQNFSKRKSNLKQSEQPRDSIKLNNALMNRYRKSASNVCQKQRKAKFVQYTDQTHYQQSFLKQNDKNNLGNGQLANNNNNSYLQNKIKKQQTSVQNLSSIHRNARAISAKTKFTRFNKKKQADNFDQLFHVARMSKNNQRVKITQQSKDKIWHQIQLRMRQSQKQYFDPLKKTNKHQHQNLIGTLQLQKKLKQELITKIYQKCNHYMYK